MMMMLVTPSDRIGDWLLEGGVILCRILDRSHRLAFASPTEYGNCISILLYPSNMKPKLTKDALDIDSFSGYCTSGGEQTKGKMQVRGIVARRWRSAILRIIVPINRGVP
jgi:hypothetical protein